MQVGGVTSSGDMDHMNFAAKPVIATKKKAAKKNVFFSDSDEEDSKPVA